MNLREILADIHALEEELLALRAQIWHPLRNLLCGLCEQRRTRRRQMDAGLWGMGERVSHVARQTGRVPP